MKSSQKKIPKELETFFAYVSDESISDNDEFIKEIHQRVEEANHDAEVIEIMTLEENARIHEIFAYDKGVAEGIEQGLTQGRSEEKLEIARNLKDAALPVDLIAKSTGLTVAEVEAL